MARTRSGFALVGLTAAGHRGCQNATQTEVDGCLQMAMIDRIDIFWTIVFLEFVKHRSEKNDNR